MGAYIQGSLEAALASKNFGLYFTNESGSELWFDKGKWSYTNGQGYYWDYESDKFYLPDEFEDFLKPIDGDIGIEDNTNACECASGRWTFGGIFDDQGIEPDETKTVIIYREGKPYPKIQWDV